MKKYIVTWSIELDAEDPVKAANAALEIQRDKSSIATEFQVKDLDSGKVYDIDTYFEGLKEIEE